MKIRFFPIWATFSILVIAAVSLVWWDPNDVPHSSLALVAATTGMAYTMLAGRGRILCYAFGFVNAPLYAYLSWRWGYYGDMALNLYYFALMFPGFVCWRRNLAQHPSPDGILRTRLSNHERIVWGAAMALATLGLWRLLIAFGGNRPLCDALTNILSIAAMILTVKRCIEQWVMWIAVDAIETSMWWKTGSGSMALLLMWALFLVDGLYLFALWIGDLKRQTRENAIKPSAIPESLHEAGRDNPNGSPHTDPSVNRIREDRKRT